MADVDYGYGEDLDYGYGEPDLVAEQAPPSFDDDNVGANHATIIEESGLANAVRRGPKRRCSVTKFSLEGDDAATPLTAASVIDAMRNGTYHTADAPTTTSSSGGDDRKMVTPQNSSDLIVIDAEDVVTVSVEDNGTTVEAAKGKKGGVLRILSLRRQK